MFLNVKFPTSVLEWDNEKIDDWIGFTADTKDDTLKWCKPRNWGGKIGVELHFLSTDGRMYWHFVEGTIQILEP